LDSWLIQALVVEKDLRWAHTVVIQAGRREDFPLVRRAAKREEIAKHVRKVRDQGMRGYRLSIRIDGGQRGVRTRVGYVIVVVKAIINITIIDIIINIIIVVTIISVIISCGDEHHGVMCGSSWVYEICFSRDPAMRS
jgi:hypothetical protein